MLEIAARDNQRLVVVSNDIEGQALAAFIANAVRGTMKICAIKAPKYGEERRNILKICAPLSGATFISRENSLTLRDTTLNHFGQCKNINITKTWTTVVGGKGNDQKD